MASKVLLPQTGNAAPAPGGTGAITSFPGSQSVRIIQVNPGPNSGPVTATLEVKGSNKPAPGATDFQTLATIDLTGHQPGSNGSFTLYIRDSSTSVQVVATAFTAGQVAVFGDGNDAAKLAGSSGTTLSQATAVVTSQLNVTVVGQNVHIAAPVVPSITSDDVTYALNFNETVTDVLDRLDSFNETITAAGVVEADVSLLAGKAAYGLTMADLCKLADVDASATELNQSVGLTGNIQTQLDAITGGFAIGPGVDITGLVVAAADINTLFDVSPTVTMTQLNNFLTGLVATAGDLNSLAGTAGDVTAVDFVKLGNITASAAEINVLNGLLTTASELNVLAGSGIVSGDIAAIVGLGATGVTATEFAFLSGLSENVQAALNTITPLPGLTSSVNDLNLLTGAFAGTGAYSGGAITAAEISRLDGITSNIQAQIDSKRNVADTIGISEITGASITTTELNFLQGATSNIQAQIDAIGTGFLSLTGGDMTGPLCLADGSVGSPSLCFTNDPGNDTGIFRTAPGFAFTVDAAQVARYDGVSLTLGTAAVTAEPLIRHSGFGLTNPQYSFVGDDDTGVTRTGADRIVLAAGGVAQVDADGVANQLTLGGPTAFNNDVVVSGLFGGIKELGRATVDGSSVANTALYTVPAGRTAIVTAILVRLSNAVVGGGSYTGSDNTMRMNIGFSPPYGQIVDNINNTTIFNPSYGFDTNMQVMPLGWGDNVFPAVSGSAGKDYQALASGAVLTASVSVGANFDSFDMDLIVLGYEL